jgi:alkanesulfonate monooxygenase SsuD/methylene tetrahydromethanopterin reductase-like flavin-dependent oxidoreductase (luciferase family)
MSAAMFGLFVPPFGELADPRVLADIAAQAEAAGWDGFFIWDHVQYRAPVRQVADPWIALAAIAARTQRVRIGALVTPLARRRPQIIARQATTLDVLSGGRMILGAALGRDQSGRELSAFGEEMDDRERAAMLDESLDLIGRLWSGTTVDHDGRHYQARDVTFEPRPVQQPRIPIWIGGRWPRRAPMRRAARWDGYFPIDLADPDQLAECAGLIRTLRGHLDGFDLVVEAAPDDDPAPWIAAGATWWLCSFGIERATVAAVRNAADTGPPVPTR